MKVELHVEPVRHEGAQVVEDRDELKRECEAARLDRFQNPIQGLVNDPLPKCVGGERA